MLPLTSVKTDVLFIYCYVIAAAFVIIATDRPSRNSEATAAIAQLELRPLPV